MSGRIALEDFDQPLANGHGRPATGNPGEAAPAAAKLPEAPEPAPPVDPEALRTASLVRIAGALDTLASEQAELQARCIRHAAAALGAAAETLMPALARAGFAAMVAETAKSIAESGQWPELVVSLAADEAADVARFLSGSAVAQRIRIDSRPAAGPGEAEITWDGGGAEIDAASIAEAILTEYRRKLDTLAQSGA